MPRVFTLVFLAGLTGALALPARGQDTSKPAPPTTSKPAPETDPDADIFLETGKYVPPGPVKSVQIGNFYLKRKKYNGALSRFQEAAQQDPNYAPAYLGLGKVYEHIGLKEKALDAYKKYLDALPSEKDALEARNVQRAVARLERQVGSKSARQHSKPTPAIDPPQSR